MTNILTKLELHGDRVNIAESHASAIIVDIFNRLGCQNDISLAITEHLIDANLCGLESHGVMRVVCQTSGFSSIYLCRKERMC